MSAKNYPSDLTDSDWKVIEPLIPGPSRLGRPPVYTKREILNGILYVVRSGCAWRMMPNDLLAWDSCYRYFSLWKNRGVWVSIHDSLCDQVRLQSGKKSAHRCDHRLSKR